MIEQETLLEVRGIKKSFSGVEVLKGVDMQIHRGEIHALIGENGAGKSTLIKILTGVLSRDEGMIVFNGKEVEIKDRHDAHELGIAVIYQELSLIPTLTVAQNVLLGREPVRPFIKLIKRKELVKTVDQLLKRYGFPLDVNVMVELLSIAQRQLVEIVKALSLNASLIIMDEPTASLTTSETDHLFKIIRDLRAQGISILFISHRMEEVFALADYITVLRDGEKVTTVKRTETSPAEIFKWMIGKNIANSSERLVLPDKAETILEIQGLTRKHYFSDISFTVHKGEVLGIAGLMGSGRTEILRAIYGADRVNAGAIYLKGEKVKINSIKQAINLGLGLIPEDRRIEGFIPLLSITRNVALTNYDLIGSNYMLRNKDELKLALKAIEMLDIRPRNPELKAHNLSGGNQQKVVLSKWLGREIKVLLVDEPTAGVDVGAKEEIYRLFNELSKQGVSILLVSSDLTELIRLSHRILILRAGRIIKQLSGGNVTETEVLAAASGIE